MNKIIKTVIIIFVIGCSTVFAFEDVFARQIDFAGQIDDPLNTTYLTANPASILYKENREIFSIKTILLMSR